MKDRKVGRYEQYSRYIKRIRKQYRKMERKQKYKYGKKKAQQQ
jgi:hypothetical protein